MHDLDRLPAFNLQLRRGYRVVPRCGGVYQVRHIESGRRYVGQTCDLYARARSHACRLRQPEDKHHPRLGSAVAEFGLDQFVFEVLAIVPNSALREFIENMIIAASRREELFNRCRYEHRLPRLRSEAT